MMPDERTTMGDLIRFPRGHQPEDTETDGATVRATAQRADQIPTQSTGFEHDATAPGSELVPDNGTRAVELARRGQLIPAALVGKAQRAAEVALPAAGQAAKFTARHGYFLLGGAFDTLSSLYGRWTGRDIDARIAAAQAAGEHGVVAELMRQRTESRKVFLERIQVFGKLALQAPKFLGVLSAVATAIVLIVSIVAQIQPGGLTFATVWSGLFEALAAGFDWAVWAASWAPWAGMALLLGVLVKGYNQRRTRQDVPNWLVADTISHDGPGVLVTADGIVAALRNLGIPRLNQKFKEGWQPQFLLTPTREGEGAFKGYRAIFDLPMGVTVEMLADKNDDKNPLLARNLNRNQIEVQVSDHGKEKGGRPGFVNLYVADSGVMDQPTPAYPLLHEGLGDVFAGVPVGITQRGEIVFFPLVGTNIVFGGLPGQGKSNAVRVVALGAALDPLAELWVYVFAKNGDFDAYEPRLARYSKGATPENAESATEALRELFAECDRREARLAELGAKKLTRSLAEKHDDLHPIVMALSECHELFGDEANGEEAADLAVRVVKRGRKLGITVVLDTQSARADAVPPKLVENVGINCCFYVKSWRNNDGFLGDGSFAAGIRATNLRYNVDRGTMVATGVSSELFEILRTFFVEVDDDSGWDAATEVIERAMTSVHPATKVNGDRPETQAEDRDLLSDLDKVLGAEPVPSADVPALLRELAPTWTPYQRMTGKSLRAELAKEHGIKVPSTNNRYPLDPTTVRSALAKRSTADLDAEE